jgi:hypothetical protein
MTLIRPRLTDHYGIAVAQERLDFAIPFIEEDIPLYVDPFLLWRSPSQQDQALHTAIVASINHFGRLSQRGKQSEAAETLVRLSECAEVGLGQAANKQGRRISRSIADDILSLFSTVPQIAQDGLHHLEELQLLVDRVSRDRISDFSCSFLKSWLIDYTTDQCSRIGIPTASVTIEEVFDLRKQGLTKEPAQLPVNPKTGQPLLLVPKRWLRYIPWISYDNYFESSVAALDEHGVSKDRGQVLNYNRQNYGLVQEYVARREREQVDCHRDPLFKPIPVVSAKRKLAEIQKLPTGKDGNADKKYEDAAVRLLASLLYPELDLADDQVRTDSGAQIRDLVFYNTESTPLLKDLRESYGSRQLVFELKNVAALDRDHVNQLNRYLADQLGRFGVLVTRHAPPRAIQQNLVDLWAGQRRAIVVLTDSDIETMVTVFESKQRPPIDVLNRAYVEFIRSCPS